MIASKAVDSEDNHRPGITIRNPKGTSSQSVQLLDVAIISSSLKGSRKLTEFGNRILKPEMVLKPKTLCGRAYRTGVGAQPYEVMCS
jgi:hypothetical protein